jgi:hypothetical protein
MIFVLQTTKRRKNIKNYAPHEVIKFSNPLNSSSFTSGLKRQKRRVKLPTGKLFLINMNKIRNILDKNLIPNLHC